MLSPLNRLHWLTLMTALVATPAIAQVSNFNRLTLAVGFEKTAAVVTGHTGGAYSLASIANSDRANRPCIGYGDPNPDHIMVLENNFPKLKLQVDSGGKDTTLVIRGPNQNTIRCNFGTDDDKDAKIEDLNWQAGQYEIWVGSMNSGQRVNYRLSAQQ